MSLLDQTKPVSNHGPDWARESECKNTASKYCTSRTKEKH